mgnify:CR=1 FL=1
MLDNAPQKTTCSLHILVAEQSLLKTAFNLKGGTERSLSLTGKIDDSEQRSAFHGKSTAIKIGSPPDTDWMEEVRTLTNETEAIGCVDVTANIEPLKYELDGEPCENEPVNILIYMNPEAFEAICFHLANPHERIISIKLELSGAALPQTGISFVFPSDLDITEKQTYAVTGIDISDTTLKEV